jgi:hypothetical protein
MDLVSISQESCNHMDLVHVILYCCFHLELGVDLANSLYTVVSSNYYTWSPLTLSSHPM